MEFVWQGGEPTLRGIDFYRKVVMHQKSYRASKTIRNSLQTNGTLLTDEWCEFLKENGFLVGLSLDGPADIHDRYRRNRAGQPTFSEVMRGLRLLKKWGVEFNVLACVAQRDGLSAARRLSFFKGTGRYLHPVYACRRTDSRSESGGARVAGLPCPSSPRGAGGQQANHPLDGGAGTIRRVYDFRF